MYLKVTILSFFVIIIFFNKSFSASFSERKEFNKILNGFYKNNILNVNILTNHGALDLKIIHMEWC